MREREQDDSGWGVPRELLVVLAADESVATAALERMTGWGQVTSRLPPRLALALLPVDRVADARGLPGVLGVFETEPPAELTGALTAGERLFVDGWLARGGTKGPRPGENQPWDPPT